MLGKLIDWHDAVRLHQKLRRAQAEQIAAKVRARGPDRILAHWPAADHAAGQVQWDAIPAIRRRWHTSGRVLSPRRARGRTPRQARQGQGRGQAEI